MASGQRARLSRLDWCLFAALAFVLVLGATKHLYHTTMDRMLREEIRRLRIEEEQYAGVIALNRELETDRDHMRMQIEIISCLKGRGAADPVLSSIAADGATRTGQP